jgi:hypothetical protein
MSIFVQKQKQIFQQILTLPSPFSPVREQIFSEILRKKSFSKVKNKSITFQKEKITCQLTVQFTSAKVMNIFIYLALPTRAGSPQQHMPITVGPFCLTHPVNFPCGSNSSNKENKPKI